MTYDVRSVANFVLDIADAEGIGVSNLALNKIIYFLHADSLHNRSIPLIDAKIEAWNHGPVFREIYHQFKMFGRDCITERAKKLDVPSGRYNVATYDIDSETTYFLRKACIRLLRISAGKLVDLSHVQDGAWHRARYQDGRVNPGVEITDDLILSAHFEQLRH